MANPRRNAYSLAPREQHSIGASVKEQTAHSALDKAYANNPDYPAGHALADKTDYARSHPLPASTATAAPVPQGPLVPLPKSNPALDSAAQSPEFRALPVGGSRVIPDKPQPPQAQAAPITGMAGMMIPPQYRVPGASPVATIKASSGPQAATGRIVDETGDRTAEFAAGGVHSGGQLPPVVKATMPQETMKAIVAKYPNVGVAGHADNAAFVKAFQSGFDPSKPMNHEQMVGMADNMFSKQYAQQNAEKNGISVTGQPGEFGSAPLMGKQPSVSLPGGTTVNQQGGSPMDALTVGGMTVNKPPSTPQINVGGVAIGGQGQGVKGTGMALTPPTAAPAPRQGAAGSALADVADAVTGTRSPQTRQPATELEKTRQRNSVGFIPGF